MTDQPKTLLERLNATVNLPEDEPDIEELRPGLRYAIYMRKSSDESSSKQQKSIEDQQIEIQKYIIARHGIDVTKAKFFKEEESAKAPHIRTKFNRMIELLKAGKLDGIIAWHPDRLSRNMLEAGIIIDLADSGVIKDMLFVGHQFENNSTGKMMLGILFTISKQYSEHLSESVTRALNEASRKGKVKTSFVHGYRRLEDDRLEPDGKNFILIKEAFRMRMGGHTVDEIAKYLNDSNYEQYNRANDQHKIVKMNTEKVSRILRNAIYAGYYKYGDRAYINLKELYEFIPAIEEDDFDKLIKLDTDGKRKFSSRGTILSDETNKVTFLHRRVTCGHCNKFMGFTTGKSKSGSIYGYFRCDNVLCPFKDLIDVNPRKHRHSISAKKVREKLTYTFLNSTIQAGGYDRYKKDFNERAKNLSYDYARNKTRLINRRTALKDDRSKTLNTINELSNRSDTDQGVITYYIENVKVYDSKLSKIKSELQKIDRQLKYLKTNIYDSEDKFFKHIEKIKNYLCKTNKLDEIDKILSIFFSNTTVLNKTISVIEPDHDWENVLSLVWLIFTTKLEPVSSVKPEFNPHRLAHASVRCAPSRKPFAYFL